MKRLITIILVCISVFSFSKTVYAADDKETPSGIPFSDIEHYIDEYMSQHIGVTSPGAAVVLVKDGQIIFSKGYGYADIENNILVDSSSTVFEYGSISKLFVYTTIMRLVEQGKIDLNRDIREYLPENFLKKLKYDKPITMLNIMNHTTGFEDYLFDVILTRSDNLPAFEQTLLTAQPVQIYEPGTVVAYSNYAVALGAYIAEKIIGQDFHAYLMDTVFEPLNMDNTSGHPMLADRPELLENKANGYVSNMDETFESGGWSYIPLYPIGGVNGTADDLALFAIALLPEEGNPGSLFEERTTLDEMFSQTHAMGPGLSGFAHGFIEFDGEFRAVGHGGNTASFSTQIYVVPEERFGVIILTNTAGEMNITSGLTEALIGKRDTTVTMGVNGLPDVSEVEGTYVAARSMHSGFLEFYGYFSPMNVRAVDTNKIELSMSGQTSIMAQTRPYVYERIEANGAIFEYHFNPVYFEVNDGEVTRMSGDYLPLPTGRTTPWLISSMLIVIISSIYLGISVFALFIIRIVRRNKGVSQPGSAKRYITLLIFCGTALLINNAVIILRMLSNVYRSFSEFRIQVFLNYPLALAAGVLIVLFIVNWKRSNLSKGYKAFSIATVIVLVLLIGTLVNWQFFHVLS